MLIYLRNCMRLTRYLICCLLVALVGVSCRGDKWGTMSVMELEIFYKPIKQKYELGEELTVSNFYDEELSELEYEMSELIYDLDLLTSRVIPMYVDEKYKYNSPARAVALLGIMASREIGKMKSEYDSLLILMEVRYMTKKLDSNDIDKRVDVLSNKARKIIKRSREYNDVIWDAYEYIQWGEPERYKLTNF